MDKTFAVNVKGVLLGCARGAARPRARLAKRGSAPWRLPVARAEGEGAAAAQASTPSPRCGAPAAGPSSTWPPSSPSWARPHRRRESALSHTTPGAPGAPRPPQPPRPSAAPAARPADRAPPPQIAYTASKGAVLALTRELACIHAKEGIRVNSLCPGPLQTELLMAFLDTEAKKRRRLARRAPRPPGGGAGWAAERGAQAGRGRGRPRLLGRQVHVPMGRFGLADEMAKARCCPGWLPPLCRCAPAVRLAASAGRRERSSWRATSRPT